MKKNEEQFAKFKTQFLELIKDAPSEFHQEWDQYIGYIEEPQLTIAIKAGCIDRLPNESQEKYNILKQRFKEQKL